MTTHDFHLLLELEHNDCVEMVAIHEIIDHVVNSNLKKVLNVN